MASVENNNDNGKQWQTMANNGNQWQPLQSRCMRGCRCQQGPQQLSWVELSRAGQFVKRLTV